MNDQDPTFYNFHGHLKVQMCKEMLLRSLMQQELLRFAAPSFIPDTSEHFKVSNIPTHQEFAKE